MKIIPVILCVTLLFLTGCNRYYYAPNMVNVPSLREKNDMRISAGFGGGFITEGADVQASYAVSKNIGIMVNGAVTQNQTGVDDFSEDERASSAFYEAGIGYFKEVDNNPKWLVEVYGGMGRGMYFLEDKNVKLPRVDLNRYFIQPSFTYTHPTKNLEFAIASRTSVVHYLGMSPLTGTGYYDSDLNRIYRQPVKLLWEPSFRFSAGFDVVKFYIGYSPSLSPSRDFGDREFMNFSLGMRLTFNTKRN